jgi:hypothetical protein
MKAGTVSAKEAFPSTCASRNCTLRNSLHQHVSASDALCRTRCSDTRSHHQRSKVKGDKPRAIACIDLSAMLNLEDSVKAELATYNGAIRGKKTALTRMLRTSFRLCGGFSGLTEVYLTSAQARAAVTQFYNTAGTKRDLLRLRAALAAAPRPPADHGLQLIDVFDVVSRSCWEAVVQLALLPVLRPAGRPASLRRAVHSDSQTCRLLARL